MTCRAELHRIEKGSLRLDRSPFLGAHLALVAVDEDAQYRLTGQGSGGHGSSDVAQHVQILDADARWSVTTLDRPVRIICIWFPEQAASALYAPPGMRLVGFDDALSRSKRGDVTLIEIASAITSLAALDASRAADCISHLVRAFVSYLSRSCAILAPEAREHDDSLTPWEVKRATDLMRSRLGEKVSLTEVSRSCGLSMGHFSRLFKRTTGLSTYQWLVEQRIEKAKELLTRTDMPLCDVAFTCGFADQAHFTRVFARKVRTTPLVWRRLTCDRRGSSAGESSGEHGWLTTKA